MKCNGCNNIFENPVIISSDGSINVETNNRRRIITTVCPKCGRIYYKYPIDITVNSSMDTLFSARSNSLEITPGGARGHSPKIELVPSEDSGNLFTLGSDGYPFVPTSTGLPDQATHAGEWLTTDGTSASWATLPPSGIPEAPIDGSTYGRNNGAWVIVTTTETDPLFTAWLTAVPNLSEFNNDVGYLTSYSETDPVFTTWLTTPPNISIFNNDAGYLISETDPVYTASSWNTTTNNSGDWDTAYSWGDHAAAGYLLSSTAASTYEPIFSILPISKGGTNSGTALNNNRVMISSGGAVVEASAITPNRALVSDANGIPIASSVTDTEIGYVSGASSNIQTQINNVAPGNARALRAARLFLYYNFR